MSYPSVTNTFVAGTFIESAKMNTNFSDIITALSSGVNEINVASVYVGNGLVGTPSITFANDLNTGMWSSGADILNFSTGGTERLELSSSGIRIGDTYVLPLTDGTNGQVLVTDGSGSISWADQSGGGLSDVVDDTTPQLGGSLDVNGNSIVSVSNGNIPITPNGTGSIVLDGLSWPQADGTANQVLTTNGSGQLSFATVSGGDVISSANLTDNAIVKGDGGSKGIQTSGIAIDDSNNITGVNEISVASVYVGNGLVGTPSITFANDLDTGIWLSSANTFNISTGGTERLELSSAGIKIGNAYTFPLTDGTANQVLVTDGSGAVTWTDQTGGGLSDVVDDTTPQLGGSLDVNGNSIVSVSNGNIPITPNGTGSIVLDGLAWPQADGTANQVLTTNGSAQLSWSTPSNGNVTSSSNLTDNAIVRGDGGSTGIQTSGITINDTNDMSGVNRFIVSNGTYSIPSITFSNDLTTGFYLAADNTLGFSTGGYARLIIASSVIQAPSMYFQTGQGTSGVPSHSFATDNNTGMWSSGADILNFSTGGTERLELSSSGIRIGDTYVLPLTDGTNGQVLVTDGSGAVTWTDQSGGGLSDVVDDTTPQLGGSLDVNGNSIVSVSNGNIPITPNGTGSIVLDGLSWPQADGTANQVLSTNGSGQLSFATVSGGGSAIPSYNINYITNHSAYTDVTGWTGVGDLDVARSNTASELPRENTLATGIKITADANTQSTADYIYYDFTLDDVDLSQDLKLCWSQKTTGTYNAGDLAVIITTQADRTTSSITPAITAIPASNGVFKTTFRASTTATLSLVIRATTDMSENGGIVISDVCITPYGKIKRTKHVGNTVLNATSNVSGNDLTATYLDGYAWCDSDNKWWFKFNLQGEFEESLSRGSIGMTGITAARTYSPLDGVDTGSYFVQNAAISFSKWSGTAYLSLAGEFPLTAEPSWAKDYLDY